MEPVSYLNKPAEDLYPIIAMDTGQTASLCSRALLGGLLLLLNFPIFAGLEAIEQYYKNTMQ